MSYSRRRATAGRGSRHRPAKPRQWRTRRRRGHGWTPSCPTWSPPSSMPRTTAIRIAGTVFRALETTGRYPEIVTVYTCTLYAARRAGDRVGEAEALNNLTVV